MGSDTASGSDKRYHRVASVGEIPMGAGRMVEVAEQEIALFNSNSQFHAISDYYRILFAVAAAWNLGAAAMLIFNPDFLLARLGVSDPAARLLARSFASSVATWGIGYALIAFDRKRFRDFAWLGAISKTIFFVIYATAFFGGRISFAAFLPGVVDLVFAVLFAEFLWRTHWYRER